MSLPFNQRDPGILLGKRTLQESSLMQHGTHSKPDGGIIESGYHEYLLQSQNLQNSLLNFNNNLAENSIEPIITRNRGKLQQI